MSATQATSRTSGRQFQEIVDAPDTFVETNPKTRIKNKACSAAGRIWRNKPTGQNRQNEPNRQKRNIAES
jgi:hypothetical protein